jgi:hypothetical protein
MPIERADIKDPTLEAFVLQILTDEGFSPRKSGDLILLEGAGVSTGDSSVSLHFNVVELDGHKIIELKSLIPTEDMDFEKAVLIAAFANQNSTTVKFRPKENLKRKTHQIEASIVIYADNLEHKEISSMLYIFLKEVDELDNKLIEQSKGN